MKVQAVTDVGRERSVNQDYVYYSLTETGSLPNLFLVADGMGGHKAGDMASRYTVETFVSLVQDSTLKDPVSIINNAVTQVNRRLLQKAAESENYEGMGTTLVAATVYDNILRVANVGDSRLYILGNEITQITRDHSLVEEMVRLGEVRKEDAKDHPDKNIITRALGAEKTVDVDFFDLKLEKGCTILMCSDGLSNMVEDEKIQEIISDPEADIDQKGSALLREANQNGGKDNIAVVLVEPFTNEVEAC